MSDTPLGQGKLGTAQDAIDFHLSGQADEPHSDFLHAWQHGDVSEWPEYQDFLMYRKLPSQRGAA